MASKTFRDIFNHFIKIKDSSILFQTNETKKIFKVCFYDNEMILSIGKKKLSLNILAIKTKNDKILDTAIAISVVMIPRQFGDAPNCNQGLTS